jgi:hypothetical protein
MAPLPTICNGIKVRYGPTRFYKLFYSHKNTREYRVLRHVAYIGRHLAPAEYIFAGVFCWQQTGRVAFAGSFLAAREDD